MSTFSCQPGPSAVLFLNDNATGIANLWKRSCGLMDAMTPQGCQTPTNEERKTENTMDGQELHRQIDHIFQNLLPAAGMTQREEQIALCHRLLDTMLNGKIALCDAGTGIGKTLAYLLAGLMFLRYRSFKHMLFRPIIISTSNIALQTELHQKYIPQLAQILAKDGWEMNLSALSVIRKGKGHYVCEEQLRKRLQEMSLYPPERRETLFALQKQVDMDMVPAISSYDQKLVQVPRICKCRQRQCRYMDFLNDCTSTPYLFQICNHNLFLADAIRRSHGYRPVFPDHCSAIIDEAHKLPETARDMLELTLNGQDVRSLIQRLKKSRFLLAADRLSDAAALLLKKLDAPPETTAFQNFTHLLSPPDTMLRKIQRTLGSEFSPPLLIQTNLLASKVSFFCHADETQTFLYTAKTETGGTMLAASLPDLSQRFQDILWKPLDSALLVSGTLAIREDFTRYKKAAGLQSVRRVEESVSLSPFNYQKNCLLYFPLTPPKVESCHYREKLTDEIVNLLKAGNGHALVLFTSYAQLTEEKKTLSKRKLPWPLYATDGNAAYIANQFRKDPGSVLLATGSFWEGMNFPGDGVSLLILPRLPFPYPNAMSEFERKKYDSLQSYIQSVALPDMLIKLRQGFGRAIRTETDTCVVAILDERAVPGSRYYQDIVSVLPPMQKTRSLQDVEEFIRRVKPEEYFKTPLIGTKDKRNVPEN